MTPRISGIDAPKAPVFRKVAAQVQCPICTHAVPADAAYSGHRLVVLRGQKCGRCKASLDASAVLYTQVAA